MKEFLKDEIANTIKNTMNESEEEIWKYIMS